MLDNPQSPVLALVPAIPSSVCRPDKGSLSFGPKPLELSKAAAVLFLRGCAVAASAFWLACFKDSGGFNVGAYLLHRYYDDMIAGLDATNPEDAYIQSPLILS